MYMWSVEHVQAQTWSPANFLCTKIPPESPDKASKSSCNILLYKHNFLLLVQTIRHLCFVLYYACVVASPFGCLLTWVPTMHANRPSRSLFIASCEILLVKEETNDEGIKKWHILAHFRELSIKMKNIYILLSMYDSFSGRWISLILDFLDFIKEWTETTDPRSYDLGQTVHFVEKDLCIRLFFQTNAFKIFLVQHIWMR